MSAAAVCRIQVRFTETSADGVVHHAHYHGWFDMVQEQLLRNLGFSFRDLKMAGAHFMPVELVCRYYAPAFYDDALEVSAEVVSVSNIKSVLEFTIVRPKDQVKIATCRGVYACVNDAFRPMVLKTVLPGVYAGLCRYAEKVIS